MALLENGKLSKEDVARLLNNPSINAKENITEKIAKLYVERNLSDSEFAVAEQIFRLLVKDSEVRIRRTLSEYLKLDAFIPKDIALNLAKDSAEDVAFPMIAMSEALDEDDLLHIIHSSEEIWRYMAVSKRENISENISNLLIDTNHYDVIKNLIDNSTCNFDEIGYKKLLNYTADRSELADNFAKRPTLPLTIAHKLMEIVSDNISDELAVNYNINKTEIIRHVHLACEQNIMQIVSHCDDFTEMRCLIKQLDAAEKLTSSMVIFSLCHGNIEFFEMSLAALADIPVENANKLINDKGEIGFNALYEKAKLPESMKDAVKLLLQAAKESRLEGYKIASTGFSSNVAVKMLSYSHNKEVDNLSYILALLRQNSSSRAA